MCVLKSRVQRECVTSAGTLHVTLSLLFSSSSSSSRRRRREILLRECARLCYSERDAERYMDE